MRTMQGYHNPKFTITKMPHKILPIIWETPLNSRRILQILRIHVLVQWNRIVIIVQRKRYVYNILWPWQKLFENKNKTDLKLKSMRNNPSRTKRRIWNVLMRMKSKTLMLKFHPLLLELCSSNEKNMILYYIYHFLLCQYSPPPQAHLIITNSQYNECFI